MKDKFNIFEANFSLMSGTIFEDIEANARILYKSDDGRFLTIVARYPNGVDGGPYGKDIPYHETFYVIQGTGRATYADGTVKYMKAGDVIYIEPGIDVAYSYDPGFIDVCFFWSATDEPLPDVLTGNLPYPPTN